MGQQDGTFVIFGIGDPDELYGLVQSYERNDSVKRAKAVAPDGQVVSIQEYADESSMTLTYLPLNGSSTDQPLIGTPFDYDDLTWQIDNISDSFTVDGFEVKAIEASYYKKIHDA